MSDEVALDQGGSKRVHRGIWTRSVMSPSVTRAELMPPLRISGTTASTFKMAQKWFRLLGDRLSFTVT
jgi:hypothetical protein